ncbi:MAG: hypothetical protein H6990_05630 [Pseudomonadales bacterium]|nr:hypothetical protein [Pseudomonadales bacterium]MCP5204336.1 hypothetical protein [Pseudomonadales bacterium]
MNWEMVSAIVDSIGAAAVVASLVFLGIQVRLQNHERRVASVHEINEAYRSSLSSLLDPGLAAVAAKGLEGYDRLDPGEKMQMVAYVLGGLKVCEEAFYQHQQGRLEDYYWMGMVQQLKDMMGLGAMSDIWGLRCHQFGEDFRSFIDNLAQEQSQLW